MRATDKRTTHTQKHPLKAAYSNWFFFVLSFCFCFVFLGHWLAPTKNYWLTQNKNKNRRTKIHPITVIIMVEHRQHLIYTAIYIYTFDSIKSHFWRWMRVNFMLSLAGPWHWWHIVTHTHTHFNHFLWFNNLLIIFIFVWCSSAAHIILSWFS